MTIETDELMEIDDTLYLPDEETYDRVQQQMEQAGYKTVYEGSEFRPYNLGVNKQYPSILPHYAYLIEHELFKFSLTFGLLREMSPVVYIEVIRSKGKRTISPSYEAFKAAQLPDDLKPLYWKFFDLEQEPEDRQIIIAQMRQNVGKEARFIHPSHKADQVDPSRKGVFQIKLIQRDFENKLCYRVVDMKHPGGIGCVAQPDEIMIG